MRIRGLSSAVLLFLTVPRAQEVVVNVPKKSHVLPILSFNFSTLSFADVNLGLVLGNIEEHKGSGLEMSAGPGISSTNVQLGLG